MNSAASRPPLARIVAIRIVIFAAVAMIGQLSAVIWEYTSDPDDLARMVLSREAKALAAGVSGPDDAPTFSVPPALARRYGGKGSGYATRIQVIDQIPLFDTCGDACELLPPTVKPPTVWVRRLREGYPLSFVGGALVEQNGRKVVVDLMVDGDPGHGVWRVLADEVIEHMAVPMTLTLVFVLGASIWSIRHALEPVRKASVAAARLDFRRSKSRLDEADMPREVAELARAVNRSFERLAGMMAEQKLFTSAIAHEIRTPLAVIKLELDGSAGSAARKASDQIDALSRFVEQLTDLARLEAADSGAFERFDLTDAAREVVASLGSWIYAQGASVAFEGEQPRMVLASKGLVTDAIRNLIENAVRHGGHGVEVSVSVETGPAVIVADNGVGLFRSTSTAGTADRYRKQGGMGIGIEIVRRIADMHGGAFEIGPRSPRGTVARLSLSERELDVAPKRSKGQIDANA